VASQAELPWWDKFADVMAKQWNLTPAMNRAIRTEYERDYEQLLFTAGGTLLDVGCGTGVRTHAQARRGMKVVGIDFSQSHLELARDLAAPLRALRRPGVPPGAAALPPRHVGERRDGETLDPIHCQTAPALRP
jgi:SAM-dependent methyltransferase